MEFVETKSEETILFQRVMISILTVVLAFCLCWTVALNTEIKELKTITNTK